MNRTTAALVAASLTLVLGACGSDPDDVDAGAAPEPSSASATSTASQTPTATPTATATASPPPSTSGADAFCRAVTAVDTAAAAAPDTYGSSPAPERTAAALEAFAATYAPLLDAMEKAAPAEIAADAATFTRVSREAGRDAGADLLDSAEFTAADAAVDDYVTRACGYPRLDVYAVDFEFDQLPDTLGAGPVAVSLRNDGQERHHIVLWRVADGATESADALAGLTPDQAATKLTVAALVEAKPGTTNLSLADLRPGRYVAACYVPEGSKRGATGHGQPHYAEGMVDEFTVS